jgi:thiol-disulfide isomerase/thioredoxin
VVLGLRRTVTRILRPNRRWAPIQIVVWSKTDCSLCDRVLAILEKLSHDYPIVVTSRDITDNPAAFERYRYLIPVVEIQGGPRLEGKITEHWLRRGLDDVMSR